MATWTPLRARWRSVEPTATGVAAITDWRARKDIQERLFIQRDRLTS